MDEKERLFAAMSKKAAGYTTEESVEEYALVDGEMTLVKRRISEKEVPPDVSAARFILEFMSDDAETLTEEQVRSEKMRLIKILLGEEKDDSAKTKRKGKM